jgi:hypothetical protein
MQKAFDRLDRQEHLIQWKWIAGIVAAFGVVMFALFALTWSLPMMTSWVSDAAQAEYVGSMMPEQGPLQTAEPARKFHSLKEFHTVRAN